MPDYSKTKIYKIYSPSNPTLCYVGHTTQKLSDRMSDHIRKLKKWKETKSSSLHQTSFKILNEYEDYRIELIEYYPCNNVEEARRQEGVWIRKLDCVNKQIAGRTMKEYKQDTKEIRHQQYLDDRDNILKKQKKYRDTHATEIRQLQKAYYEQHKERVLKRQKEYTKKNSNDISKRRKEYRKTNKDVLAAKQKELIKCECGMLITKANIAAHKKRTAHETHMRHPMYDKHKNVMQELRVARNLQCHICYKFYHKTSMTRHLRDVHGYV